MERLFLCILSMSLSGALIGLALLLMHPVTKKVFSKKWNYYIWLLLVVRLLLPIHFETANSLQIPLPEAGSPGFTQPIPYTEAKDSALSAADTNAVLPEVPEINEDLPETAEANPILPKTAGGETADAGISGKGNFVSVNWPFVLMLIWLLGAGISFLVKGINYRNFAECICKNSKRITDGEIPVLARETAARLSMKKVPDIYESGAVSGPVTLGLCRPIIILPKEPAPELQKDFSEMPAVERYLKSPKRGETPAQFSLVLHHEFIHVKRKDLWYKWLYQILLCVHWFNPILYFVGRQLNIDCELACDESVVGTLTAEGKRAYGNILIDAAERNVCFKGNIPSTTLLGRRQDLKERLKGILHYKKTGKIKMLASLCMVCCLLYLSACGSVQVSREAMPIRLSTSDSSTSYEDSTEDGEEDSSFFSLIPDFFKVDADSFLAGAGTANKYGKCWKIYDDEGMIAGEDDHDQWQAYSYSGGDGQLRVKGFAINGSETVLIAQAPKEQTIKVESSYKMVAGKFKLALVKPDGSVELIDDTGEWGVREVALEKGRNVIKMVGQGAKLKELKVTFNLNVKDFDAVYSSEQEEYVDHTLESIKAGDVDKEKVFEVLPYMEDEMVSEVLAAMLARKVPLTGREICNLFIYSDENLSEKYLVQAMEKGDFKPDKEMVTDLMPYLGDGSRGSLIKALGADMDWELIKDCMPYLDDEERKEVLLAYMDNGNVITFTQYSEIAPYLSDEVARELDRYLEQK